MAAGTVNLPTLVQKIILDSSAYQRGANEAAAANQRMARSATEAATAVERGQSTAARAASITFGNVAKAAQNVGRDLSTFVTLPMVAVGAGALKLSIDFESAFAGVRKTVDATEPEFAALRQQIRDMAKEVPASTTEIARVAEAAGQLGVRTDSIMSFTRTMIDMGVATNLSSDQAAEALARLANITQLPHDEFDRLGSTVVHLGNKMAATESDIVEMGLRIAGAGHQVGLTEDQILSFAAALSSVGIEAEMGGSAISRTFVKLANAVGEGGDKLTGFAEVAGMSASDFAAAFERDAAGATVSFIEGLGRIGEAGTNLFPILEELGIKEIRERDALLRAAGAGDLFRQALQQGSVAWQENSALTKEATERYKTTESQLKILVNRVKDAGMSLGDGMAPALLLVMDRIDPLIGFITRTAEGFERLSPGAQQVIIVLGGLVAAAGPLLWIAGSLGGAILNVVKVFQIWKATSAAVAAGNAALGASWVAAALPVALVVAAVAAVGAALFVAYQKVDWFREAVDASWQGLQAGWDAVSGFFVDLWQNQIGPAIRAIGDAITAMDPIWQGLWKGAQGAWNGVTAAAVATWHALQGVWNGISAAAVAAWHVIQPVWDGFLAGMRGIYEGVRALDPVWSALWHAAQAAWNGITIAANDAWVVLQAIWNGIVILAVGAWHAIQPAWDGIIAGARVAWEILKAAFEGVSWWVTNVTIPALQGLWEAAKVVWGGIQIAVELAWSVIQVVWAGIKFGIDNLVAVFQHWWNVVTTVWNGISTVISTVWSVVQPIWATIVDWVKFQLAVTFEAFRIVAETVWNALSTVVSAVWGVVEPIWSAVAGFLSDTLGTAFEGFRIIAEAAWNALSSVVSTVWSVVEPIWNRIRDFVENVLVGAFHTLRDAASEAWGVFQSAAESAWGGVRSVMGSALRVVGDAVGVFLEAVSGIARVVGLTPLADNLANWAGSAFGWGEGLAAGGRIGGPRGVGAGFVTNGPTAVVGEGKREWPEYVVPTDPAYRSNAVGLAMSLWRDLGLPQMQMGGILDRAGDALGTLADLGTGVAGGVADALAGAVKWTVDMARQLGRAGLARVWPLLDVGADLGGIVPAAVNTARDAVLDFIWAGTEKAAQELAMATAGGGGPGLPGSTSGLNPDFLDRFNRWNESLGGILTIVSGFRTRAEQQRLYDAYLAGTGNLAAPPGFSKHEQGLAIDHSPSWWGMGEEPFGLHHPVASEPWHVEPFDKGWGWLMPGWNAAWNGTGKPEFLASGGVIPEDDPRFDWRTMGNQARGVLINGQYYWQHADGRLERKPEGDIRAIGAETSGAWVPDPHTPGWLVPTQTADKPAFGASNWPDDAPKWPEFYENDRNSPNRGKPGYVQAEDGSWVPTSFYSGRPQGVPIAGVQKPMSLANSAAGQSKGISGRSGRSLDPETQRLADAIAAAMDGVTLAAEGAVVIEIDGEVLANKTVRFTTRAQNNERRARSRA